MKDNLIHANQAGIAECARSFVYCLAALAIGSTSGLAETVDVRAVIFNAAQVSEGKIIFAEKCAACHGQKLEGGAAPALNGDRFSHRWKRGDRTLKEFYAALLRMPWNAAGTLPDSQYEDLAAFVLSENGFSAGPLPLTGAVLAVRPAITLAPLGERRESQDGHLPAIVSYAGPATTSSPLDSELLAPNAADWSMFNRDYQGQRFSTLNQINVRNASRLKAICMLQLGEVGSFSSAPIVYKGRGYVTTPNGTYAFDAATCHRIWEHHYIATDTEAWPSNRGAALYRGLLFRGTPDGHLLALDANTGSVIWNVRVAVSDNGYFLSAAPIVIGGSVLIGLAGADWGASGKLFAFDALTGKELWSFNLIPTDNAVGAESWVKGAATGGGSTWSTVSVDPVAGLVYVPVGNPAPDFDAAARPGANLFSDSVVALDWRSGRLAWFAQQVPNDSHDWDTGAAPVLYDDGAKHLMAVAGKSGWLFIYDRDARELVAKAETTTHLNADKVPSDDPLRICPGADGGSEWNGPALDPSRHALFVGAVDWCGKFQLDKRQTDYVPGQLFLGGSFSPDPPSQASGWIRSFDATTGRQIWARHEAAPVVAGLTPTAGDILLAGTTNGDFLVLKSADGQVLFSFNTGGAVAGGIAAFAVREREYIAVTSGSQSRSGLGTAGAATVIIFSLEDSPQNAKHKARPLQTQTR